MRCLTLTIAGREAARPQPQSPQSRQSPQSPQRPSLAARSHPSTWTARVRGFVWVGGTAARLVGESPGSPAALYRSLGGAIKAQFLPNPFSGSEGKGLTCEE